MTADPNNEVSDDDVLAALADLAASRDPRDAPPAPTADAVRLAALEATLPDRVEAANRRAARGRRSVLAAWACAAAVVVAAGVWAVRADRRADAAAARFGAELAAVRVLAARPAPADPRAWEEPLDALAADHAATAAAVAEARATLADLDDFADALLAAHRRQGESLRAVRAAVRDGDAARRAELNALAARVSEARDTARRRFLLLAGAATDPPADLPPGI